MKNHYKVNWTKTALKKLFSLYEVNHDMVYRDSKVILKNNPKGEGEIIEYPGFDYNGYLWSKIRNVIVIYELKNETQTVTIKACYSAMTGFALKAFYGEFDTEPLE